MRIVQTTGSDLDSTAATVNMSRRKRDAESDAIESTMANELHGSSRVELDDSVSSRVRSSRHRHSITRASDPTAIRPESLAFQAAAEPPVQAPAQRTRSVSRSSGSASGASTLSSSTQSRRQSSTPKRDQSDVAGSALARQSLTSSASALRPSKQRSERNRLLSRAHIERHALLDRHNNDNNSHELGDNDTDDGYGGSRSNNNELTSDGAIGGEWKYDRAGNAVPAAPLPSRIRLYRHSQPQCDSRGDDRTEEAASARRDRKAARASLASSSTPTPAQFDRPPSRQSHAFPTHLIDTNAFASQPPARTDSTSRGSNRSKRDRTVHSANAGVPPDATTTERPPSRYMTKVKRNAAAFSSGPSKATRSPRTSASSLGAPASDAQSMATRQLSRRCVDSVCSLNQVNHDPKTDGFADVDESVPPPFRIEITTDSHRAAAAPGRRQRESTSTDEQIDAYAARNSLQSRRRSSFGNQEQLLQHMTPPSGEERSHTLAGNSVARGDTRYG